MTKARQEMEEGTLKRVGARLASKLSSPETTSSDEKTESRRKKDHQAAEVENQFASQVPDSGENRGATRETCADTPSSHANSRLDGGSDQNMANIGRFSGESARFSETFSRWQPEDTGAHGNKGGHFSGSSKNFSENKSMPVSSSEADSNPFRGATKGTPGPVAQAEYRASSIGGTYRRAENVSQRASNSQTFGDKINPFLSAVVGGMAEMATQTATSGADSNTFSKNGSQSGDAGRNLKQQGFQYDKPRPENGTFYQQKGEFGMKYYAARDSRLMPCSD